MTTMTMERTRTISVILSDDHPLLLRGLHDLLAAEPDFDVVATARDGNSALALINELDPDIAVLDLSMPGMTGLEILNAGARAANRSRVIFLTAMINDDQILDAIAAGVWGIMMKESAPEELIDCVRAVASGKKWLPPELVEPAILRQATKKKDERVLTHLLTPREQQIVQLVCEGLSNKHIARALNLSNGTVRIHLHNIFCKLNVTNRTALAAMILGARE